MDISKVDAEAAGFDAKRLGRIADHVNGSYIDTGKIAGAQAAVYRNGECAYFQSFGNADRERSKPVAEDTIWRLYSMTKPVTGVALMTLYERGIFQLDDPVHRWIPEWKGLEVRAGKDPDGSYTTVPAHRPPSVKDVMMHMAGIGYGQNNGQLDMTQNSFLGGLTLETLCQQIGTWPLRFQPGTQWLYSFGMDVCARLVEVMSGLAFDDYLKQELFGPLGMVDTDFFVPEDKQGRLAACYARNARKELVLMDDPEKSTYRRKPSLLNGGGGLVGTTSDYLRFAAMLANGGELDGVRILSRKTVELMGTNHLPGNGDMAEFALPGGYGEVGFSGAGFGLTMSVAHPPALTASVGTAGEMMWGGAASTTFFVDRAEDLAVVFMTQLMPSGTFNFRGQLKTIVYGALSD